MLLVLGFITALVVHVFFVSMTTLTLIKTKKQYGEIGWPVDLLALASISAMPVAVLWMQL